MNAQEKLALCAGCRQNFYNGNNPYGVKRCYHFAKARKVRRWRIGWWTPCDKAENFVAETVLSCYDRTGSAAYYETLPRHLGGAKPPREKR